MGCFGFVVIDVLKDVMSLFNKLFYEYLEIIKMCFYNLMMVGYKGQIKKGLCVLFDVKKLVLYVGGGVIIVNVDQ